MRIFISVSIFVLIAVAISGSAFAVPAYMHHSGRIVKANTVPVAGAVSTTFSIYSQLEGGSALWSETFDVVYNDGYYSVSLGQETSLDLSLFEDLADGEALYLGVTLESEEFGPRVEITTMPFAFMAGTTSEIINSDGLWLNSTQIVSDSGDWLGNHVGMNTDEIDTYLTDNSYVTQSDLETYLEDSDYIDLGVLETYLSDNDYIIGDNVMPTTAYSSEGDLPAAGENTGTLAFVEDVSQIFYSNGSEWNNIAGQSSSWAICRGFDIDGVCITGNKYNSSGFYEASNWCAAKNSDICSDSQMTILLRERIMRQASWTNSYADNDSGQWNVANGGTGDNHGQSTAYGVACCTNSIPPGDIASENVAGVRVTHLANEAIYYWEQATSTCATLRSDVCTKAQYSVLRSNGSISVNVWAHDHSDNDGQQWAAFIGSVSDDPNNNQVYGFACCAGTRPIDGSCPGTDVNGVCVAKVVNSGVNFPTASADCASEGVDICSMSESYVLRQAGTITHAHNWTDAGADVDSNNAPNAVGSGGHDNASPGNSWGYACCY